MINGKPDEIDNKLMELLQLDASVDVSRLAKLVHRTANPIHDRIRKLKEAGYIKGYIAVLNRELIGQPVLVVVHVKLKEQAREQLCCYEQSITVMPEVQFCLHVSGEWDFILHVTAATPQLYYVFLMEQICGQPNVAHVQSCFVMKECKSYSPFKLFA
ncbi:MAG: Lrp/AsnC family transcriptional regulator [Mucilaginibacter sp.]|nr:Lrp/AsnC family transcriptional regulator [Mucilaginibacter sp.]